MHRAIKWSAFVGALIGFFYALIRLLSAPTAHIPPIVLLPLVGPIYAIIGAAICAVAAKLIVKSSPPSSTDAKKPSFGFKTAICVLAIVGTPFLLLLSGDDSLQIVFQCMPYIVVWIVGWFIAFFVWALH